MNGNCYSADGVNPTQDGEPAFTLTGQDRHGVAIGVIDDQGRTQKKCEVKETVPTLRSESHGNQPKAVVCIEDFYKGRSARVYDEEAPTLRSDRTGLKVGTEVDNE